jgi:single-strand DNA-binding protein
MSLPNITLVGNLTTDPILRHTQAGKPVTSLRVACNDRKKNQTTGLWEDGDTTFIDVTVWRNTEAIQRQLFKGSKVLVIGTLRQKDFQTAAGEKRTAYEVQADEVALLMIDKATGTTTQVNSVTSNGIDPWTQPAITGLDDERPF